MKIVNRSLRTLMISTLAATSIMVAGTTTSAAAWKDPKPGETVNIGFLGALSGPDAGWGLPGLTGNQMFVDEVNAEGGLLVNGNRYPLKMFTFDDEAVGSKALQGAKELVLRHDVKVEEEMSTDDFQGSGHPFNEKPLRGRWCNVEHLKGHIAIPAWCQDSSDFFAVLLDLPAQQHLVQRFHHRQELLFFLCRRRAEHIGGSVREILVW
ncbi:MAG: ABC transporter substrate-binding protein, partial [Proteobacteria bacterium]|nr:ABC transporter substrate-binding protein [Pseudomonadota bacterium]